MKDELCMAMHLTMSSVSVALSIPFRCLTVSVIGTRCREIVRLKLEISAVKMPQNVAEAIDAHVK